MYWSLSSDPDQNVMGILRVLLLNEDFMEFISIFFFLDQLGV